MWLAGLALTWAALAGRAAAVTAGAADLTGVRFEQRLGATLPLDAPLRDSEGRTTSLRAITGQQPAVLVFGYARCPQLCSVIANAAVEVLRGVKTEAGKAFSVVYVSIDPTDTARDLAALKRRDVRHYGRGDNPAAWHYVSGSPAALKAITEAAGFHYTYDPNTKLYAHPSGFVILTPDGRIAQYFLGIDFRAADVAQALARAAENRTGNVVFDLVLACARGLGPSGRYGRVIGLTLETGVVLTVLGLFGGIGWMLYQERRDRRPESGGAS